MNAPNVSTEERPDRAESRPLIRGVAAALIPLAAVACCVSGLVRHPDWLVVNGTTPIIDRADPLQARGVGNDLTSVFLPKFVATTRRLARGEIFPTWDPSGFGGRPLVGNPQAGVFYPPLWVTWAVGRPSSLGWLTVAHLGWAGVGAYVLMRGLGVTRASAGLAAGAFASSPYLMAHFYEGHYPHLWAVSWYPWAFAAFLAMTHGGRVGAFGLPPCLALCFLGGHPQEWYYLMVAVGCWALADACRVARSGGIGRGLWRLGGVGSLVALSLAFCAAELLPELQVRPWLLARSTIPLNMVTRYHVHGINLFQLINPFALGPPETYFGNDNYWETVLSIGLIPLLLFATGVALRGRERACRAWLLLVVICAMLAAGRRLGLYPLFYAVLPGMDRFRVPARTLFLATLGASVVVGFGIDSIACPGLTDTQFLRLRRRSRAVLAILAVLLLAGRLLGEPSFAAQGLVAAAPTDASRAVRNLGSNPVVWVAVLGAFGLLTARLPRRGVGYGLGVLALIELSLTAQALLVLSPPAPFMTPGDAAQEAGGSAASADGTAPTRVAADPRVLSDLDAALVGLELTNVNDGFQLQHSADFYERLYPFLGETRRPGRPEGAMDGPTEQFQATVAKAVLDRFSVRDVFTTRRFSELGLDGEPRRSGRLAFWSQRDADALPWAYVAPCAIVPADDGRTLPPEVALARIDPRAGVVMDLDPLPPGPREPFAPARSVRAETSGTEIRATTTRPGLLVVSTTWMPGWRALVDGRPEPVLRGNHWQIVVPIRDDGDHQIRLKYEPPGFALGLVVTGGAVALWAGAGLISWRLHRKGR